VSEPSPFATKRYEHDGDHVYYIPPATFDSLEATIPTFLIGTRGTGKTTLLKALSWDERLYNARLRRQLKGPTFQKHYIGVYFKLPMIQLRLINRWLESSDDADFAAAFSFYLDLCWLETLLPAIEHLAARRELGIDDEGEQALVKSVAELWEDYPLCRELLGEVGDSLFDVLRLMHPLRRVVERYARRRVDLAEVLDALPVGQIGSFGRLLGSAVAKAITDGTGKSDWSFRVCMDEGEALTLRQQRVINSIVRLAEWPVFYVVAYVSRPEDATGTFLPGQSLQLADRQVLVRDEMSDKDFRQLAEGVVNVRLEAMGLRQRLNCQRSFGRLSIDGLLERILRESENPDMRGLLDRAKAATPSGVPRIYETYIRERRDLGLAPQARFDKRRQSSASIRKQMVAAYLTICREARSDVMYASADMLLQVSDNCIRDFLWQIESVFAASDMQLAQFLTERVPDPRQHAGMRAAAELKMTLFQEKIISAPAEANRIVVGLARITHLIQSTGRNYEQIRTPERGIFTYLVDASTASIENAVLIRDAAEAGFLRLIDEDAKPNEIRFRVHASLAPRYNFSYRGAYYAGGTLSTADVESLRRATTEGMLRTAVDVLAARVTGRRPSRRTTRDDDEQTLPIEGVDDV
jgi:hypothetical protein